MNQTATISNESGKTLTLNLKSFFEKFEGVQVVPLASGEVHEVGVECYTPQAEERVRAFCQTEGVPYCRKTGLFLIVEPTAE